MLKLAAKNSNLSVCRRLVKPQIQARRGCCHHVGEVQSVREDQSILFDDNTGENRVSGIDLNLTKYFLTLAEQPEVD